MTFDEIWGHLLSILWHPLPSYGNLFFKSRWILQFSNFLETDWLTSIIILMMILLSKYIFKKLAQTPNVIKVLLLSSLFELFSEFLVFSFQPVSSISKINQFFVCTVFILLLYIILTKCAVIHFVLRKLWNCRHKQTIYWNVNDVDSIV